MKWNLDVWELPGRASAISWVSGPIGGRVERIQHFNKIFDAPNAAIIQSNLSDVELNFKLDESIDSFIDEIVLN